MTTSNTCNLLQSILNNGNSGGQAFSGNGTLSVSAFTSGSGVFLGFINTADTTQNFITSMPAGWTKITSMAVGGGSYALELWYLLNATAGTTSLAYSTTKSGYIVGGEFSGVLSTSALDLSSTGTASGGSQTATASLASQANTVELIIGLCGAGGGGKGAGYAGLPANWNLVSHQTSKSGAPIQMVYQIRMATSGGASYAQPNSPASVGISNIIASFKLVPNLIQPRDARTNANSIVTSTGPVSTLTLAQTPLPGNVIQLYHTNNSALGGTLNGAGAVAQTSLVYGQDDIKQANGSTIDVWTSAVIAGSVGTTVSTTNSGALALCEWYGMNKVDQKIEATAANAAGVGPTTYSSGTLPNAVQAPSMAIFSTSGYYNQITGGGWGSPTNGFTTLLSSAISGQQGQLLVAYKILDSAGSGTSTTVTQTQTLATINNTNILANYYNGSSSEQLTMTTSGCGAI